VDATGSWRAECWIGNTDFPPHAGDEVDVVGVAAKPSAVAGKLHVSDPKDLVPAARSHVVHFTLRPVR